MTQTPFDRLERQLDLAAHRQIAALAPAPRHRRRVSGMVAVLIATPLVAATAWAASTLIPSGPAVVYKTGVPVSGKGVGAAVPKSVTVLTTSVPDPDGGLPWGLRSFRTTRGLVCLQVGRVQEGKLGILGRDGSFDDDGRFHELRPGTVSDENQCFPPDGAGQAFLTFHRNSLPASGDGTGCLPSADGCKPSALRAVAYGLLGPRATAVRVRSDRGVEIRATLGALGGYLVVRRPLMPAPFPKRFRRFAMPGASFFQDDYGATLTPASRIVERVEYGSDGACTVKAYTIVTQRKSRGGCPDPPGFVPIPQTAPRDVRARVTATAGAGKAIRVRFTARVAVHDRLSAYNVMVFPPAAATRCPTRRADGSPLPAAMRNPRARCGGASGDETDRNILAGSTVVKDMSLYRRPPGRYRVMVSYRTQSPHPERMAGPAPDTGPGRAGTWPTPARQSARPLPSSGEAERLPSFTPSARSHDRGYRAL